MELIHVKLLRLNLDTKIKLRFFMIVPICFYLIFCLSVFLKVLSVIHGLDPKF